MSLASVLSSITPREVSGSETAKRYNYQKDLSLWMLIELYETEDDYVLLFDFHDDIVVIDSEDEPKKIRFYQVKTKGSGYWLANDFIKCEDGKLSILGKLYKNKIDFEAFTESLNFITNAGIKLKLKSDKYSETLHDFTANELHKTVIGQINQKIQSEHSLTDLPEFEKITNFKVHSLSLKDSSTHCTGALNLLFERLNPNYSGNTSHAYKKIFNEVKIKTEKTINVSRTTDFKLILREKGISKREFDQIIRLAGLYRNPDQIWSNIHTTLTASRASLAQISQLKGCWKDYNIKVINSPSNIPIKKTIEYVTEQTKQCLTKPECHSLNLIQLMQVIESSCTTLPYDIFDNKFIKGAILNAIFND